MFSCFVEIVTYFPTFSPQFASAAPGSLLGKPEWGWLGDAEWEGLRGADGGFGKDGLFNPAMLQFIREPAHPEAQAGREHRAPLGAQPLRDDRLLQPVAFVPLLGRDGLGKATCQVAKVTVVHRHQSTEDDIQFASVHVDLRRRLLFRHRPPLPPLRWTIRK